MDALYFTPFRPEDPARARGCLTCTNFHGQFYGGHLLCERDGGRQVIGVPAMGCAFWEREQERMTSEQAERIARGDGRAGCCHRVVRDPLRILKSADDPW